MIVGDEIIVVRAPRVLNANGLRGIIENVGLHGYYVILKKKPTPTRYDPGPASVFFFEAEIAPIPALEQLAKAAE